MTTAPLTVRLQAARRCLRRRVLAELCVSMLGFGAATGLILDACDRLAGLREETALLLAAGSAAVVLLLFTLLLFRSLLRFPDVRALALRVEACRPELLDSLICGVEIEQRAPDRRGLLEQALLLRVARETQVLDLVRETLPPRFHWPRILIQGFLFVLLTVLALESPVMAKARFRLFALAGKADNGLRVAPGNAEVAVRSDVTVTAEIRRWERQADILCRDARGLRRYRMVAAGGNDPAFTFYNLREAVRYRVITPVLCSPWYNLSVFVPPVIRQFRGQVIPPAYTGLPPISIAQGENVRAVIGSRFEATIEVATGVHPCLIADGQEHPLQRVSPQQWKLDWPLARNQEVAFRLRDLAGHRAEFPPFRLECLPDFPPVLELLPPAHDQETTPEVPVTVGARAADDLGLSDIAISYSVAGQGRKVRSLFPLPAPARASGSPVANAKPVREQGVQATIDPLHLKLKDGDVVSFFFTASDNRQPQPQTVRSAVLFITVRDLVQADANRQASGEMQNVDIGALIAEQKRLLRLTWDSTGWEATERQVRLPELRNQVKDLAVEIRKTMAKTMSGATGAGTDPVSAALARAAGELDMAEALLRQALLEESVPPQERSLAALIAAETELLKNAAAAAAQQQAGKSEAKESKPQDSSPQEQPRKSGASAQDALQQLRKFLETTRQLSRRQEELNRTLESLARRTPTLAELSNPATQQRALDKETRELASAMAVHPFCQRPACELDGAATTMTAGVRTLESGDAPEGHRQGARAHLSLLSAVQSLEALYRQVAGAQIRQLAEQARQLSERQRGEAGATEQLARQAVPVPEPEAARRQQLQNRMQEASRMLQEDIGRAATAMEESFPEAAGALSGALQKSRDENVDGAMTRAGNALLYRKFDKASQFQSDAANGLKRLADRVTESLRQLPSVSHDELLGALSRIREAKERVKEAMERDRETAAKRLAEVQSQMQGEMDRLAEALSDSAAQKLGESFRESLDPDPDQAGRRLFELLTAAERLVEKQLTAAELKRRLLLKRKVSRIPEGYRDLIENYFKNLSESE